MSLLQLAITTRFNGVTVDTAVVPLDRPRFVGDEPGSDAPFPGPTLDVTPVPGGAKVGPVTLKPGGHFTLDLGEVEVEFTIVARRAAPRGRAPVFDMRLLVATGALLVFGMWWDTLNRWARTNPEVVAELEALPAMWDRFSGNEPDAIPSKRLRIPEATYVQDAPIDGQGGEPE